MGERVELDIRVAATSEGLAALVPILREVATELERRGIRQWRPADAERDLERLAATGTFVLLRDDARAAGGCVVTESARPAWSGHAGAALYVHRLVVMPRLRGRGLGTEVLRFVEGLARERGRESVRLDCWDGNERLRRWYRSAGYEELESVREDGYRVRLFERRDG